MRYLSRALAAGFLLTALSVSLPAQDGKNIRTILIVKVKPDRRADWQAAAKEFIALKKKAGSDEYFTTWSSETGPSEYAIVWHNAKWKELDEEQDPKTKDVAGELGSLFARLDGATESTEVWVDEIQPDLGFHTGTEIPKMVRTGRTRVVPDKLEEALAILKSDALPAMKKAGVTEFGVALARYGTPINEIHTFAAFGAWADLDSPWGMQKAMSADAYKAYLAKIRPDVTFTEYDLWRFKPELSFVPEPK
jgi:quinol monooxygenase YgiN